MVDQGVFAALVVSPRDRSGLRRLSRRLVDSVACVRVAAAYMSNCPCAAGSERRRGSAKAQNNAPPLSLIPTGTAFRCR